MADQKKRSEEEPTRVTFDFIKSPHFRAVRADGAIGGVTPNGQIHVAFYSERPPIPRRVVHAVGPGGKLGEEVGREARDAIVREMDFDLFLSLSVAKSVHQWLGARIAELEARQESLQKRKKE
jgi:hypothetical protein